MPHHLSTTSEILFIAVMLILTELSYPIRLTSSFAFMSQTFNGSMETRMVSLLEVSTFKVWKEHHNVEDRRYAQSVFL